jgi:hypothetical protein
VVYFSIGSDVVDASDPQEDAMDSPFARRPFTARCALALALACLAVVAAPGAQAQDDPTARSAKGTKRPPAPPSSSQGIPAGTDSGTPGTSRGAELGLETMPTTDAERAGVKKETAAARAAARRKVPLSPDAGASGPVPMTPTVLTNGAKNGSKSSATGNGTKSATASSMAASGTATAKKDGKAWTP